ncbi:hypothetical protein CP981_05665 [Streptomyces platensis]|uniref:Uncharacterized protein n=1 Tax=Streptomyces platensis TaxID=58346 RepID=A0AAE6TL62_STRPT|nr:hypothetical protein [Streptomyces platensis]OSY46476.1 hypothetical protein BG653_02148 [Streptomyces platensis]QEV51227.1 hypothetical protein CP981_05665 [Streptomyces platensis]
MFENGKFTARRQPTDTWACQCTGGRRPRLGRRLADPSRSRNLDQKVDRLGEKLDGFIAERRPVNATLVELRSSLAGKAPNAG